MIKCSIILLLVVMMNVRLTKGQEAGFSNVTVNILIGNEMMESDPELRALISCLKSLGLHEVNTITPKYLVRKPEMLSQATVLWIFKNDSLLFGKAFFGKMIPVLRQYVAEGGKILLANQAASMITNLGLETVAPVTRPKPSVDEGYGRQLGYHAFVEHAIFDGMNGGAYVIKPLSDTTVLQTGWFGENKPASGQVIAVDWDYIFLREESKLVVEYDYGRGKVLAVGGYLLYSMPNRNRVHLERFTQNILAYLSGKMEGKDCRYWHYGPSKAIDTNFALEYAETREILPLVMEQAPNDILDIAPGRSSGNYWDLAGERMLVMGTDHGGITEVWSHPVMCLRDYKVSVITGEDLKKEDLAGLHPDIEVKRSEYQRRYNLTGDLTGGLLNESIAVSPNKPIAIAQYEYTGNHSIKLAIDFKLLFRLMWPYSEKVLGNLYYSWDEDLKAVIASDQSCEFVTVVGIGTDRDVISNNEENIHITYSERVKDDDNPFGMSSQDFSLLVTSPGSFSFAVIMVSSAEGLEKASETYLEARSDPGKVFLEAKEHTDSLLEQSLQIFSPDEGFNKGYGWALLATDRFQVNTPGIGSSLVAGYATSDKGWDGEHAGSGRPGYGWYFGRDGEWSGFALLHYGDFAKVKLMLETFSKYQDLNGKIFHELSTSGIAHYDAADPTPLYIVLAGRYLHHSGDITFIDQIMPNILKAIDYCYSTDTDGDKLIENTNVGHGWEEGGHLFGCHTTLYLASCWAEALDQAAYMASALNEDERVERYRLDAIQVKAMINNNFWNQETEYFQHGLMQDGSYKPDLSIMPTIPMLFGQTDPGKAWKVLPVIATNAFTTDWGCRIVPENDPHFNPRGYHTGSVWPLFTGWAALAEFRTGNYLQGFSHLSSNLMIWQYWGLGFNEEVLNGEVFEPSGVCHHQCWSETMALEPVIEGMLGYQPDALKHQLKLKPWFPMDWDTVQVSNIRLGEERISMEAWKQGGREAGDQGGNLEASGLQPDACWMSTYTFSKSSSTRLDVQFQPVLPHGCKVEKITVNGQPARDWGVREAPQGWVIPEFGFWLDSIAVVEITWHGGITALPIVSSPQPGDRSAGFRIISTSLNDSSYTITIQAPGASRQEFRIWAAEPGKVKADGAEITAIEGNIITLRTEFADLETDYALKNIEIRW